MNLVLGQPCDKIATASEHMFLPDFLLSAFDSAVIVRNGEILPLVDKKVTIYKANDEIKNNKFKISPFLVFTIILIIGISLTLIEYRKKKHFRYFDAAIFTIIGFFGIFILLLWFATDHPSFVKNWNILWAIPTHFIFGIALFKARKHNFIWLYFIISGLITALTIAFWNIIPQGFDFAFLPIMILLCIRSFNIGFMGINKIKIKGF